MSHRQRSVWICFLQERIAHGVRMTTDHIKLEQTRGTRPARYNREQEKPSHTRQTIGHAKTGWYTILDHSQEMPRTEIAASVTSRQRDHALIVSVWQSLPTVSAVVFSKSFSPFSSGLANKKQVTNHVHNNHFIERTTRGSVSQTSEVHEMS